MIMYKRRTYKRRGRQVIGFYKDTKGRTRPITLRKGRKRRPAFSHPKELTKKQLNVVISLVLSQAPIVKELHSAYILADAIYENWDLVTQLYDIYEKKGWQGVANIIGSSIAQNASSAQTEIAWTIISPYIPTEYQSIGKHIFASIMNQLTSEEISLVKQFLQMR
jgi:hypothetical protein